MKKIDLATYTKPSDFVRFPQGETTIRIISSGVLQKKHGMKTARGYIPLPDCTETPDCPECLKGNEPKQKWTWVCMVRPTGDVRILDVGPMVGDAICKIMQARKLDFQDADLLISKSGEGLKTNYIVKVGTVQPITEEEKKSTAAMKSFLIKKYFSGN